MKATSKRRALHRLMALLMASVMMLGMSFVLATPATAASPVPPPAFSTSYSDRSCNPDGSGTVTVSILLAEPDHHAQQTVGVYVLRGGEGEGFEGVRPLNAAGEYSHVVELSQSGSTLITPTVFEAHDSERKLGSQSFMPCTPDGFPPITTPLPVFGGDWIVDDPNVRGDAHWDAEKVNSAPPNTVFVYALNSQGELVVTTTSRYKFDDGSTVHNYGKPVDVYNPPPTPPATNVCVLEARAGYAKVKWGSVTRSYYFSSTFYVPAVCLTESQAKAFERKIGIL